MRLVEDHPQRTQSRGGRAELAEADAVGEPRMDHACEEFSRGVATGEFGFLVEVAEGQRREHGAQGVRGEADVDHQPVGVQRVAPELGIHDVGGAMQALRGPEHFAAETVGNHHMVADADGIHRTGSGNLSRSNGCGGTG